MRPSSVVGVPFDSVRHFRASKDPYYCTPPVNIPTVLGVPAVWRHNNQKKPSLSQEPGNFRRKIYINQTEGL